MTVDPEILTKGNTYTVDKGTTIRLPCYVDKFPSKCRIMSNHYQYYWILS